MNKSEYQEILVLEGLEAVRKRPGMYIGRIGSAGIFNMFKEIFDNSIDEYLQGKCSEIYVKKKGGGYYISDNGRGIPVNYSEKFKKTTLEIVLEILHSGGKFNKENYRFSGGLHGVGLSVVNALSEYFEICSFRDGFSYKLVYRKGKKEGKLIKKKINERVGTEIFFIPDPEILFTKELNLLDLEQFLEECSYLHKGLKIKYEINGSLKIFYNLEGIKAYLHEILDRKKALKIPSTSFNLEIKENLFELDFAGVYCEDQEETNYSIVNGIRTPLGGTHVSIIRTLWIRIINELKMNSKFKNLKFSSQDIFLDFHLFISLKYSEPIFEGQTKERLSNPELKKIISEPIYSFFQKLFQENFQLKEAILEKIHKSHNFNKSLRETKEVLKKKVFSERGILFGLAGKLTDCRSKDSSKNELFIVEGKSAGGNAKNARNLEFQAILPIRGKTVNIMKKSIKILKDESFSNILMAIGINPFEEILKESRYGKIILMTDADVDGYHICCLLLTFLYKYLKKLFHENRIYIALPPLYRVISKKGSEYLYREKELQEYFEKTLSSPKIKRYKGLGVMNEVELWNTTMNPKTRKIINLKFREDGKFDELLEILMGKDVKKRREFLLSNF